MAERRRPAQKAERAYESYCVSVVMAGGRIEYDIWHREASEQ